MPNQWAPTANPNVTKQARIRWLLGFGVLAILGSFGIKRVFALRAHHYLETALDVIQSHHVRRSEIDWADVRAEAYRQSVDSLTSAQTHGAIRMALARIGDHHSGLIEPELFRTLNNLTVADNPPPESRLLPDRIAYIRVPSFVGANETASREEGARIHQAIASVDRLYPCAWIVDLRSDGGGNMWPMLAGLAPLLGDGTLGAFVSPDGTSVSWSLSDGRIVEGYATRATVPSPYRLQAPLPPVAVLLGHSTVSSGEAVAVAFIGRSNARSFGKHTMGYSTSNAQFPLSDGAVLNLSVSTFADRHGRLYPNGIQPDVVTDEEPDDSVPAPAQEWLLAQRSCKP